jgi:hypothetical protein
MYINNKTFCINSTKMKEEYVKKHYKNFKYNDIKEIEHQKIKSNDIDYNMYLVPIHSFLNHDNVIGKHLLNKYITWNKKKLKIA